MRETRIELFNKKYKILPNGCHQWTANKTKYDGRAYFRAGDKMVVAARWLYEYTHNIKIPRNIDCCHTCDNPSCVNIEHLFLGTRKDNIRDSVAKGRFIKGEKANKSKLEYNQVVVIKEAINNFTLTSIAKYFNVSHAAISAIKRGFTWRHVF